MIKSSAPIRDRGVAGPLPSRVSAVAIFTPDAPIQPLLNPNVSFDGDGSNPSPANWQAFMGTYYEHMFQVPSTSRGLMMLRIVT